MKLVQYNKYSVSIVDTGALELLDQNISSHYADKASVFKTKLKKLPVLIKILRNLNINL